MGQTKSSKRKREVLSKILLAHIIVGGQEKDVLKKIFANLLIRSSSEHGLDPRAFSDFLALPV